MNLKEALKKGSLFVIGAVALVLYGAQAHAATVSSQLFLGELNQLSDNSGESQNVDVAAPAPSLTDGFLWLGDTLRGTLDFGTVEDLSGGGGKNTLGAGGVNELSGIFEIEVLTAVVLLDPDGSCLGDPACAVAGAALSGDELANYTFGPNAAFAAEFGVAAGTMLVLYEDTTPDYDRTQALQADIEDDATDGPGGLDAVIVLTLGFFGDADELWQAIAVSTDPSLASLVAQGTFLGGFSVQLSIGVNSLFSQWVQVLAGIATGVIGADGLIDFNGSGGISGTLGSGSFYDVFNNVDLVFRPTSIPEPGTLGLMGFGLLALGLIAARRRRR
jgi:hypothetical protein